ncbi:MAG: HAMP domain-containing histidine kinase [Candidatus Taylorbacteria bacterium]|nr:HAMP domain-containing histidine kinase [Candidatus Taylorbacteria bacterium]
MSKYFENIISYILGGISGIAVGYITLSFDLPILSRGYDEIDIFFLIIASLLGMLVSAAFREYSKIKLIKHNTELKNEIVSLITHEMRSGITYTNWVIEFVLQKYGVAFSQEDKDRLSRVVYSTQKTVLHSVNLLDVSLLEIEKLSIYREKMRLGAVEAVIKEVVEKYTFGYKRKGIQFTYAIHLDSEKEVEVDIMRIRIVIENLLENSIQYAGEGDKSFSLTVNNDETTLNIVISDTGIGIPQSEHSKIFSEFYRASNARNKLVNGSGISLYMSKKYIEAHHGTIRFESEEHKGTTFFITLPLKTAEDIKEFLTKV